MPKFAVGAPPELLKGDARDMQRLRQYLMQLCDALANTINNLDGSNIRPGGLTSASFKNLAVEMVKAAKAEIGRAEIGWAQVQKLEAKVAEICTATIETADINWANILDLTAKIAEISRAEIDDADIDFAQIKDLVANKAIITKGVNGKLYVTDLAVTEANMVSLTTGALMVKGQDGSFYQITVTEDGAVKPVLVEVEGENLANETIPGGKLIENTITARELNVAQIFANEAVMVELTANMGKFADLFANEAVIGQLRTHLIETDYLKVKVGRDEVISAINMTEEVAKIMAKRIEFEGLVTANENFKVLLDGSIEAKNADISGKVTANGGSIGGWNIEQGMLYSGAGANRVALATADATYALWAGAEASGSAPFRVMRDGSVYLTRLYVTDEDGNAQSEPVNLNRSYWKVDAAYARAVKTMQVEGDTLTITLNNGTSVNFKKAGLDTSRLALNQGDPQGRGVYVYNADSHTYNCQKTVYLYDTEGNYLGLYSTVNETSGTEAYDAGYTSGKGAGYNTGFAAGKDSYLPTVVTRTGYSVANKSVTVKVSNSHQDLLTGKTVDATEIYDGGYSAGYAAGWAAAKAKIGLSGNVITGPSSTVDGSETLYTVTAGGSINSITNTAANYFRAAGYGRAYVNGTQVDYVSISKAQQISVGQ